MRRSRMGTWVAAVAGAALGVGVVALYGAGVIAGATLNPSTQHTASREPSSVVAIEHQSAVLAQARHLAAAPTESATLAPAVAAPVAEASTEAAPTSTPEPQPMIQSARPADADLPPVEDGVSESPATPPVDDAPTNPY